jgi:hypothetical protein
MCKRIITYGFVWGAKRGARGEARRQSGAATRGKASGRTALSERGYSDGQFWRYRGEEMEAKHAFLRNELPS